MCRGAVSEALHPSAGASAISDRYTGSEQLSFELFEGSRVLHHWTAVVVNKALLEHQDSSAEDPN